MALIHLEQEFDNNVHTMRGNAAHEGVRSERSLPVWSDRLGLVGKCDVVEFWPDGRIYPVEYKHGSKRAKPHDDLQLAAQAMCLEEMTGKIVAHGAIYHHSSRRRREITVTQALRHQVEATVAAIRQILNSGQLPPPVNDARCRECSLKEICQPQALAAVDRAKTLRRGLFTVDDEDVSVD